jgi:hypothetical protein
MHGIELWRIAETLEELPSAQHKAAHARYAKSANLKVLLRGSKL